MNKETIIGAASVYDRIPRQNLEMLHLEKKISYFHMNMGELCPQFAKREY